MPPIYWKGIADNLDGGWADANIGMQQTGSVAVFQVFKVNMISFYT